VRTHNEIEEVTHNRGKLGNQTLHKGLPAGLYTKETLE